MSRFFFDLDECGAATTDEEGRECADLAAARASAIDAIREILCAEVALGRMCLSCRIKILDQDRAPVLTVPFREAVTVSGL